MLSLGAQTSYGKSKPAAWCGQHAQEGRGQIPLRRESPCGRYANIR